MKKKTNKKQKIDKSKTEKKLEIDLDTSLLPEILKQRKQLFEDLKYL